MRKFYAVHEGIRLAIYNRDKHVFPIRTPLSCCTGAKATIETVFPRNGSRWSSARNRILKWSTRALLEARRVYRYTRRLGDSSRSPVSLSQSRFRDRIKRTRHIQDERTTILEVEIIREQKDYMWSFASRLAVPCRTARRKCIVRPQLWAYLWKLVRWIFTTS